jgi:hypothetical protein
MENEAKTRFLESLALKLGKPHRFGESRSLFQIEGTDIRFYVRYSKIHENNSTFYGLRAKDLQEIQGFNSFLCLLWEGQKEPLIIPYSEYEDVFQSVAPAEDGQYKTLLFLQDDAIELYVARAGRFNVEGYLGWAQIEAMATTKGRSAIPELSHSQVQTLLGAIGAVKDFDIWIPAIDRSKLDWSIAHEFGHRETLPHGLEKVADTLSEIDVAWLQRGANVIKALFEIEHSTPIYSGLLRFNDIHLSIPNLKARFNIVANNERRALFIRQLNRPTFQTSGLGEVCSFLEYSDVYNWHKRVGGANAQ